jgi:hypothetical protein
VFCPVDLKRKGIWNCERAPQLNQRLAAAFQPGLTKKISSRPSSRRSMIGRYLGRPSAQMIRLYELLSSSVPSKQISIGKLTRSIKYCGRKGLYDSSA